MRTSTGVSRACVAASYATPDGVCSVGTSRYRPGAVGNVAGTDSPSATTWARAGSTMDPVRSGTTRSTAGASCGIATAGEDAGSGSLTGSLGGSWNSPCATELVGDGCAAGVAATVADADGDADGKGPGDADGPTDVLADALGEALGDALADVLAEGTADGLADAPGLASGDAGGPPDGVAPAPGLAEGPGDAPAAGCGATDVSVGGASSRIGSHRRPTCAPFGRLVAFPAASGMVTFVSVLAIGSVASFRVPNLIAALASVGTGGGPAAAADALPIAPLLSSFAVTPRDTRER